MPADRRTRFAYQAPIHDVGNSPLLTRVFLRPRARPQRAARQDSVSAGQPPPGHGWLARRLARIAPMYYATHCIAPCLAIVDGEAEVVSCFGSGRIRDELVARYGSPFAVETAHIKLKDSDLCARVYRSLFDAARQYRESFDVFGMKMSLEWPLIEGEGLVLHTAKQPQPRMAERVRPPDYADLLPEPIRHFTTKTFFDLPAYRHLARGEGGDPDGTHAHLVADPGSLEGHGGSHPHLVHKFISALL